MKKKRFALCLAAVLALSTLGTAFCENTTLTEAGTSDCTVTAVLDSTYSVQLPLSLELTKQADDSYSADYTFGVKGVIANNKGITVNPQESFPMTGAISGTELTASVTQADTQFYNGNASYRFASGTGITINGTTYTEKTGTVRVSSIEEADSYSGTLTFTIALTNLTSA